MFGWESAAFRVYSVGTDLYFLTNPYCYEAVLLYINRYRPLYADDPVSLPAAVNHPIRKSETDKGWF